MTIIELSDEEARQFLRFREHQSFFEALEKAQVFHVENGQAILHFNARGDLMSVETHQITFRKTS